MSDDQLQQAQSFIIQQFKAYQPRLIKAFGNIEETIKEDFTPVTELDKQIELDLREALTTFDPGIGFMGEELGQSGNTETFWLIDPIDGTESFIRGIPSSRNVVTLIDKGLPIMTVVYKFITDELFTAIVGKGSYKDGQRLHCSSRQLSRTWVELWAPLSDEAVFPIVNQLRKIINGYRVTGDFPLVLEGKVDAMLSYKSPGGDWDYAMRALLMQEAGGRVANIGSDTYDYRNHDFLGANPKIFDQLMEVIVGAH